MVGIVGYGADMPRNRIKVEEIAKVWGADAAAYRRGLMLEEKSVPSPDQDVITMSVEAARRAVRRASINPAEIGAIYIGSESHPYAVKPSGTVVAEALGATPDIHCADYEFACKAGSEGMFVAHGLVKVLEFAKGLEGKSGSEKIQALTAELINNTGTYSANFPIIKNKDELGKLKEKL